MTLLLSILTLAIFLIAFAITRTIRNRQAEPDTTSHYRCPECGMNWDKEGRGYAICPDCQTAVEPHKP